MTRLYVNGSNLVEVTQALAWSPAQVKKKEASAGDEKPALRKNCVG